MVGQQYSPVPMLEKQYSKQQSKQVLLKLKAVDEGKFGMEMLTKLATQKKEKAMKEIDRRKAYGITSSIQRQAARRKIHSQTSK